MHLGLRMSILPSDPEGCNRLRVFIIIDCFLRDTIRSPGPADPRMGDELQSRQVTPLSLLERARAADQQAWHRLAALYQPLVLFWCRQAGCPPTESEDVAQEVFAAVATGLGSFRRDRPGDTFRGWLRGITRNQ